MARRGEELDVKVKCVEVRGQCQAYDLGEEMIWNWGTEHQMKCSALKVVLRTFALLCSLGVPSWEEDPGKWYISCPSKKGIVVSLEAVEPGGSQ